MLFVCLHLVPIPQHECIKSAHYTMPLCHQKEKVRERGKGRTSEISKQLAHLWNISQFFCILHQAKKNQKGENQKY